MKRTQEEIIEKYILSVDRKFIQKNVLLDFLDFDTVKQLITKNSLDLIERGYTEWGEYDVVPQIKMELKTAYKSFLKEPEKRDEELKELIFYIITWVWLDSEEIYKEIEEYIIQDEFETRPFDICRILKIIDILKKFYL